jgi:4-amino-4-deoxy-L-arabinose transferase-like glycosyltransferase
VPVIETTTQLQQETCLLDPNSRLFKLLLIMVFVVAALIRSDDIRAPGHLIEREYNSAVFARAFYFQNNDNIEPWRQEIAQVNRERFPVLEPPLTEFLVSILYRILGQEGIWYARYLTNGFWLIGGIFLFRIVTMLISANAALLSLAFYLFAPWGIIISRSFQPDALMMMTFLMSLYFMVRYFEVPTWHRLILSAVFSGLAILLRPLVIFTLFGAFIVLFITAKRNWKFFLDPQFIVFISICLTFPLAFYVYSIVIDEGLRGLTASRFRPHLLIRLRFWREWVELAALAVGPSAIAAAFLGYFFLPKNRIRTLMIGLSAGYLAFGLTLTYHIITHTYYHIQLIPIVSVCTSVFFIHIGMVIKKQLPKYWALPVLAVVVFLLYFGILEFRRNLYTSVFEPPAVATEIGEVVHHSLRTVFVSHHYGDPLTYYGEFSGAPWPVSIDDPFYGLPGKRELTVQERLDSFGYDPEYFIITNFELFERKHQDLKMYLRENCAVFASQETYLIYNACQK